MEAYDEDAHSKRSSSSSRRKHKKTGAAAQGEQEKKIMQQQGFRTRQGKQTQGGNKALQGRGGVEDIVSFDEEEGNSEEEEECPPMNPSMAAALAAAAAAESAAALLLKARALINSHTSTGPGMDFRIPSDPGAAKTEDEMCLLSAARDILSLPRVSGRRKADGGIENALFSPSGVAFLLGSHLAAVLLFADLSGEPQQRGENISAVIRGVGVGKVSGGSRRHRLYVLFSCRSMRYAVELEQEESVVHR